MQVPIGRSGVHALPNTLHSKGLITPFECKAVSYTHLTLPTIYSV